MGGCICFSFRYLEEELPGAISGWEAVESEKWMGNAKTAGSLPGGVGQQAGSGASSNVCALQKKNFLGRGLAPLRA